MRNHRSLSLATRVATTAFALSACSSTPEGKGADAGSATTDSGPSTLPKDAARDVSNLLSVDAADESATPDADGAMDAATAPDAPVESESDDAADTGTVTVPDSTVGAEPSDDDADVTPDAAVDAAPPGYTNPVLAQDFPDPFVLRQGATYFAFATNAGSKNVQAAQSTTLSDWTVLPDALPTLPSWASSNAGLTWAPSVLPLGPSTFVMYYTARDIVSGFQCISRATATSPAGPYVDSSSSPFICQVANPNLCGSIDPSPFVDSGGTAYLVWKTDENAPPCSTAPRLWGAQLTSDGLALAGPATNLLTSDRSWQGSIIEGPAMTVVSGVYYLLYSANAYESPLYSMGYATCLSPVGPCENVSISRAAISSLGAALGPGGGSFFEDELGNPWLAYHAWTAPKTTYGTGGARTLRIDRVSFAGGVLSMQGPTTTPQLF